MLLVILLLNKSQAEFSFQLTGKTFLKSKYPKLSCIIEPYLQTYLPKIQIKNQFSN